MSNLGGMISFDGTLAGQITGGGGGGGDSVIIAPVITSGTKIADVSVNGVDKDLYCPTPTEVEVTPVQQSGTKIATIEVDNVEQDLYAPSPTQVSINQVQQSGTKIASIAVNGANTDIYAPDGGEHEYSTSEHTVGNWVDGRPVYEKTIFIDVPSGAGRFDLVTLDSNIDLIISQTAFMYLSNYIRFLPYTDIGNYDTNIYFNLPTLYLAVENDSWEGYKLCITIQYTKSSDLS